EAEVRRVARALLALGVARGDRVAVWAPNGWRWIVAALAAHSAGAALVPINTRYKGEEARYVLARSSARLLFTVTEFLDTDYPALLRAAGVPLPALEAGVLASGEVRAAGEAQATWTTWAWEAFVAQGDRTPDSQAEARALAVEPEDLSDIMFTSG